MSSFLKNLFGQASNGEPEAGKKVNHVVVDIEITEHEYMAFDADDEMVGGESSFSMEMTLLVLSASL